MADNKLAVGIAGVLFDMTLQRTTSLTNVNAMEDQEPSVDHREMLVVGRSERVVTKEVEMSDVVSEPAQSTTVPADQVAVTGAGASIDDALAEAAISDEDYQLEQLENVQVAIKVCYHLLVNVLMALG